MTDKINERDLLGEIIAAWWEGNPNRPPLEPRSKNSLIDMILEQGFMRSSPDAPEKGKINDGGPAFPTQDRAFVYPQEWVNKPEINNKLHAITVECKGMSLRDYFAGQALIALIQLDPRETDHLDNPNSRDIKNWIAANAYLMADAMIKERDANSQANLDGSGGMPEEING